MKISYTEVLKFWFEEIEPKQWWHKDKKFDDLIRERFANIHLLATQNKLWDWRDRPESALAEIIILDQFSRNLYRGNKLAFANDELALKLAMSAIEKGFDKSLNINQLLFLYMPFMHSESKPIHEKAIQLFNKKGLESNLEYELQHKAIIDRFGRYPYRNEALGRKSTPEEILFLQTSTSF